jgi:hypothetical protein
MSLPLTSYGITIYHTLTLLTVGLLNLLHGAGNTSKILSTREKQEIQYTE